MAHEKFSLLIISGFGDKGISELADTLNQTGEFSKTEVMQGCPWWHAGTSPRETGHGMNSAKIATVSKIIMDMI